MCTTDRFYFIISYHCIMHAMTLYIVLTLLISVLSAILFNFNESMGINSNFEVYSEELLTHQDVCARSWQVRQLM